VIKEHLTKNLFCLFDQHVYICLFVSGIRDIGRINI
jgi:hypothetical protein